MVWLCQVGSLFYDKKPWGKASVTTKLPLILEVIHKIFSELSADHILLQQIIDNFLHEDLHGYIIDHKSTYTISDTIKTMYFKPIDIEYLPQSDLLIEIAASLPKLLPREWDIISINLKVEGKRISELDLLDAGQILVSSAALENEHMEYVIQSLGDIISRRFQEKSLEKNDSEITTPWIKKLYSRLCQLIGKLIGP